MDKGIVQAVEEEKVAHVAFHVRFEKGWRHVVEEIIAFIRVPVQYLVRPQGEHQRAVVQRQDSGTSSFSPIGIVHIVIRVIGNGILTKLMVFLDGVWLPILVEVVKKDVALVASAEHPFLARIGVFEQRQSAVML